MIRMKASMFTQEQQANPSTTSRTKNGRDPLQASGCPGSVGANEWRYRNSVEQGSAVGRNEVTNPLVVIDVYVPQSAAWKLASLSSTRLLDQYASYRDPSS